MADVPTWSSIRSTGAAAASTLALLGSLLLPVATPTAALAQSSDHSHWMADNAAVIGQRYLQQLIIPGSHDSGTYSGTNQPIAQAQDNSFLQQLQFGIRYLDLRAKYVAGRQVLEGLDDDYYFYHGPVNTNVKLTTLIDQVAEFYASPANQNELTILDFSGSSSAIGDVDPTGDTNQRFSQICAAFQQKLGPYLIDQTMLPKDTDIGHVTLNEIWSLPGKPRIITNLSSCAPAGYWPLSTFGGYYANQCYVEPYTLYSGIVSSIEGGLRNRSQSNNFFALSVAATPTSDCFFPLYYLNIDQKQELLALGRVKGWFDLNEQNGRRNLNIVYGDYVTNTPLVDNAIEMNQAGPSVTIGGSATLPSQPLTVGQSVTLGCKHDAKFPVNKLEVGGQPTVATNNPNDNLSVQVKAVADNDSHLQVATCTDASGRAARVALPIAHASTATPVWIINKHGQILYLDTATSKWAAVDGGGTRIAVARDGQPWVINARGEVYRRDAGKSGYRDGKWALVGPAGTASDIAAGLFGSVWVIGGQGADADGNRDVLCYNPQTGTFTPQGGSGVSIAVAQDGQPWVVNAAGEVWQGVVRGIDWNIPTPANGWLRDYSTKEWRKVPGPNGRLGTLTVGPWGSAWAIANDFPIFQYDGSTWNWSQMGGGAGGTDIAADAEGVWAVNQQGQIWRYTSSTSTWTIISSDVGATAIGVSMARLAP